MRDEINAGLVGIVSEGTDYTTDLALSVAGGQDRRRLLPIAGAGALENVKDVVFARGVDFGIVQTNVLDDIKRNPPFPGVEKFLQYVTKLYDQELHVLAGPDIKSLGDLIGDVIFCLNPAPASKPASLHRTDKGRAPTLNLDVG